MRSTMQTRIAAGVVAVSGLLVLASFAHAGGCCGGVGGGSRGGFLPRAFYSAPTARGGASCCNMTGMAMGGMNMAATPQAPMAGMNMAAPAPAAPQNGMAGMNMAAPAPPAPAPAPAAAGAQYFCPMHPTVVSTGPATCPYCQMDLERR